MPSSTTESQAAENGNSQDSPEVTHELASKVADRVFQLLKQEARLENERHRPYYNHQPTKQGGR